MSRRRLMAVGLAVLAFSAVGAGAIAAVPFHSHVSSLTTITISGGVTVTGTGGRTGLVRARYVLPRTWHRIGRLDAARIRFDTRNSCGHKVAFTARLVQAPDLPASERATALTTPVGRPVFVRSSGTRDAAAFRVVSLRGTDTLRGVMVQPLATRWADPGATGQRIYAEISATATADPRRACHAGGPRGVAAAFGATFAAGHAGGFVLR